MELDIISIITQVVPNGNCVIIAINNTSLVVSCSIHWKSRGKMDNMIVEVVVEDWDQIAHDVHSNL